LKPCSPPIYGCPLPSVLPPIQSFDFCGPYVCRQITPTSPKMPPYAVGNASKRPGPSGSSTVSRNSVNTNRGPSHKAKPPKRPCTSCIRDTQYVGAYVCHSLFLSNDPVQCNQIVPRCGTCAERGSHCSYDNIDPPEEYRKKLFFSQEVMERHFELRGWLNKLATDIIPDNVKPLGPRPGTNINPGYVKKKPRMRRRTARTSV
jgi:hypothetical protein